jgi:aminotransferase
MNINIFQPELRDEELEAVREVFLSNWIGKGPKTDAFEKAFAQHLGVPAGQIKSINSCTEGLFSAMQLLEIGPGDEVIMPSISFVGAGNAVRAAGAKIAFCDVDPRTLNATADTIEPKLTPRTRAVVIIHYGGYPAEMDEIMTLLKNKGVALVEDSACSVASRYRGRACGTFGDIGTWSFDAMKILVTGDGGMLYLRDETLAERAARINYLGLTSGSGFSSGVDRRWWEFDVEEFGRRSITNDIASAIGLVQLSKLNRFVERRKEIHTAYDEALDDLEWLTLPPRLPASCASSYYFYWVQTDPARRDDLARFLRERAIYTTFRYFPLHWVKAYGAIGESLPGCEVAARTTLCLPIHQGLTQSDIERVADSVRAFAERE